MLVRAAVAAALALLGLSLSVWAGGAGLASADPDLPVDPLVPTPADPAAAQQTMLGQFAQVAQSNPVAMMQDLLASSPHPPVIGLAPPPPGQAPAGPDPISLAQLLMPQNYRMPSDDQISPYALQPNSNPSPFARINAFKGVHALTHSNLGRMPGDQLGQPLPGTAAPPGSNLPPGLEQFYVDPAATPPAPPADAAPVDPLLIPLEPPVPPAPPN